MGFPIPSSYFGSSPFRDTPGFSLLRTLETLQNIRTPWGPSPIPSSYFGGTQGSALSCKHEMQNFWFLVSLFYHQEAIFPTQ